MTDYRNDDGFDRHPPVGRPAEQPPEPYRSASFEPPQPPGHQGRGSLTDVRWSVGTGIGLVVAMVVFTLLSGAAVGFARLQGFDPLMESVIIGVSLTMSYVLVMAVVWIASRRKGATLSAAVGLRPVSLSSVIGWGVGLAIGGRIIAGVWGVALEVFDIDLPGADIDPTRLFGTGAAGVIITVLVGVILAPVVEEVVFRGVLLPALDDRIGRVAATVLSSAAFAAVHLYAFTIPPIFVLALLFSLSFFKTNSLWTPIIAHALFNGIGIGLVYLARSLGAL